MKNPLTRNNPFISVLYILVFTVLSVHSTPVNAQAPSPQVLQLKYDGPVTSVMVDYISRGIQDAENQSYSAVILEMNTPAEVLN